MLAKKFRLPSSIVFQHPLFLREQEFSVKAQTNTLTHNRYGFVVAKKIDKRATVRNRLKRVMRSCLESKWLGRGGKDILFVIRPAIKGVSREILQQKIDAIMKGLFS